jgi:hypothetical protein
MVFGPGHSDEIGWGRHFLATFGTTSSRFATLEVNRIAEALRAAGKITEQDINAALAVLSGQNPKDEIEAMLLAQMAVTHALFMRKAGHLGRSEQIPQQDSNGLALARLSKAFASQVEALAKLRRGGEQLVRVEHVHVHSGGQAIVGNVNHNGGGAPPEKDGQAHAGSTTTPAIEGRSAMWSENPQRPPVPVSRRSR